MHASKSTIFASSGSTKPATAGQVFSEITELGLSAEGIQLVCLDPNRMLGLGMQPAAADRVA